MILSGSIVRIAPQWLGPNESPEFLYIVMGDEEKGRVDITPLDWKVGNFPPVNTVTVDMIELV